MFTVNFKNSLPKLGCIYSRRCILLIIVNLRSMQFVFFWKWLYNEKGYINFYAFPLLCVHIKESNKLPRTEIWLSKTEVWRKQEAWKISGNCRDIIKDVNSLVSSKCAGPKPWWKNGIRTHDFQVLLQVKLPGPISLYVV